MLKVVRRNTPIGVHEEIAGRHVVTLDAFRAKLGHGAFHVWQVLCAHRDRNGYTHITTKGISRAKHFVRISERVAKKGLAKLHLAGLIELVGWRVRRVPTKFGFSDVKVYVRRVRGAALPHIDDEARVCIPDATKKWGKTAAVWGGKRVGAGRKRRGNPVTESNSRGADPQNSRGATDIRESSLVLHGDFSSASRKKKSEPAASAVSVQISIHHEGGAPVPKEKAAEVPHIVGSRTLPVRLLSTPAEGLPPYPGATLIENARVPHPPLLKPESEPEVWASTLATLYRNCVEKRYRIRSFLFRKGDIKRSKHYAKLVEFAKLLMQHEIPPAAWIAWRVDEWRTNKTGVARPALPPLNVVFSVRAITETRWRYREAMAGGQLGGLVIFTKSHRELLRRFHQMYAAINRGATKPAARARYFPGDLWDVLLDAARCEAAELRLQYSSRLKRGEFLW